MKHPYVVSADLVALIHQWANNKGFVTPAQCVFEELRKGMVNFLQKIFPTVELISEKELSTGLSRLIHASGLFPLSMDGVYFQSEPSLGVTRAVNEMGEDVGMRPRFGFPSLLTQIQAVKRKGISEVVLIDDVVFSGGQLAAVISTLRECKVAVPLVCAGVVIYEGQQRLTNCKVEVQAVRRFNEVIDEICERDFYPGVPRSGRFVAESNNLGMPYILPFGQPGKWASIPNSWQTPFSSFCIEQTIRLFEAIEKKSRRQVLMTDLPRFISGLPQDNSRFVDVLKETL